MKYLRAMMWFYLAFGVGLYLLSKNPVLGWIVYPLSFISGLLAADELDK